MTRVKESGMRVGRRREEMEGEKERERERRRKKKRGIYYYVPGRAMPPQNNML